jgi:KUP system potassium uptake protein
VLATGFFLLVDLTFVSAALAKVADGGWFPLALGLALFALMTTWRRGRGRLLASVRGASVPLGAFLQPLFAHPPQRVPGTAVFLTATPDVTPHALLHSLKHYKVLHERNVFLTVSFEDVPAVPRAEGVRCEDLGGDAWRVTLRYGFMDRPDVAAALELCAPQGLHVEPAEVSYFLSREILVPGAGADRMAPWRERLFAALARNAGSAIDYFNIPANRVVELGTRVEM